MFRECKLIVKYFKIKIKMTVYFQTQPLSKYFDCYNNYEVDNCGYSELQFSFIMTVMLFSRSSFPTEQIFFLLGVIAQQ